MDRQVGGYILEEKLGEGGMGAVYRARHPSAPGRPVALKLLRGAGEAPPSQAQIARFQREMLALARVQHPNVVRILGGSLVPPVPFYAMELVAGEPLDRFLARGPLEPRRAATVVRAVADAIAAAHAQGILHRDLKPSNVVLEAGDRPRVLDFGVALVAEADRLTRTGVFVGSIGYAAPEQLAGEAYRADERTDVYGLGAILWASLVGRGPFDDKLDAGKPRNFADAPVAPSRHVPTVPRELDAVVLRALDAAPEHRYASAAAFRDDLDRWLRGQPVTAFESSAVRRAAQSVRTSRPLRAVALVLVAAALGAVAVVVAQRAFAGRRIAALLEEAQAPAARTADLRVALASLEREKAPEDALARVRERLRVKELEDVLAAAAAKPRPGDPPPAAALEAAAQAAARAPEPVGLVGEREGLALGDALLDARDDLAAARGVAAVASQSAALLERAQELARARLARDGADAAAHALRAYAELARLQAPRRPLGPGTLGLAAATAPALVADLEAARALPGAPGARAAWLLVDLLLAAPDRPPVDAALEAARARAPDSPARAPLEAVLATPRTAEGFASLVREVAPGRPPVHSVVLSRFFARLGIPAAAEHPECALDPRAAERIVALEPADAEPPFPFDSPGNPAFNEWGTTREKTAGETHATRRPKLLPIARRALELAATHPTALHLGSEPCFERLSQGVFSVLAAAHASHYLYTCNDEFHRGVRAGEGGATETGFRLHSARWETGSGLAGCEEFDRRLEEDLARDELVAAALAGGLPRAELALGASAARGLRRLDELEADPPEDPVERARVSYGAILGVEDLARLRRDSALCFRARVRAVALPAPLGPALARLDLLRLARAIRVWANTAQASSFPDRYALVAAKGASLAAGLPGCDAVEHELFDLAARLVKESGIRMGPDNLPVELTRLRQSLRLSPLFRGLKLDDPARRSAFDATPEDVARARRRYVYWPPPRVAGKTDLPPAVPAHDAILVSAVFPARLAPGEVGPCVVTIRNAGTSAWTEATCHLGVLHDNAGDASRLLARAKNATRISLPAARVEPGATAVFDFDVAGPPEARDYRIELQMLEEGGGWFGDVATGTCTVAPR